MMRSDSPMDAAEIAAATARIAEIDAMFERASGWGSWMVAAANEREAIVNRLRAAGVEMQHKHLARTACGRRTD